MILKNDDLKKLNRMGSQLTENEKILETHPLTQGKWVIVQTALSYLNLQTRWSLAGSFARQIITLQAAFLGYQTEKSSIGFIGPHLERVQDLAIQLMSTTVVKYDIGSIDLFKVFVQMITIGVAFITTQSLGNWKGLFPNKDKIAAKKGGMLLQELGLIWLLSSKTVDQIFLSVAKEMKLNQRHQKFVQEVGIFYILLLIIILTDEEEKYREELLETLERYMIKSLPSIEIALEKMIDRGLIDELELTTAISQLQMIKISLENRDTEALILSLRTAFQIFGLPYEKIKQDIQELTKYCAGINETFKTFFYNAETMVTTVNQSA